MTRITAAEIVLPWPPAAMSPNASGQGEWRRKSGAARAYKSACAAICREKGRALPCLTGQVVTRVTLTFCPPSGRAYDLDNGLARVKQGLDAVAEAIGVDDAHWRSMALRRGERCKGGAVIVTIEVGEGAE